jgi:nicotinamide mononucleotide (NMN) deamidase PncC
VVLAAGAVLHQSTDLERCRVVVGQFGELRGVGVELGETGATGPAGNPYGDAPGHCCYAIAGPSGTVAFTLETGDSDRLQNMLVFSRHILAALLEQVTASD